MKNINTEIFLSYCWADESVANGIYDYFKNKKNITLHRDKINISAWGSIKEYMQSIGNINYTILLISDTYLKSANCMYEVLEVMRDRNYKDKIFPAVISTHIYNPIERVKYVKYWKKEFDELHNELYGLEPHEMGKIGEDLKRRQDIKSNIATFLDAISDMNNPEIPDLTVRIEEKLRSKGLLETIKQNPVSSNNLFDALWLPKRSYNTEPTDLDINQFLADSYKQIVILLKKLCEEYQQENTEFYISTEQVDSRNTIFQFYKKGNLVRELKVFLNRFGRSDNIGVSDNVLSFGSNNSWNGMYNSKVINGELKLIATMSFSHSQETMTIEEVVVDIWKNYIQMYLER
ncbi:MAG: toll/interleukin-1 receptor domain-containing protein [Aminipila sp.]